MIGNLPLSGHSIVFLKTGIEIMNASAAAGKVPEQTILLDIFRKMALMRLNDDQVVRQIKAGKLTVPYYSARGQECIPAAISVSLTQQDYLVTIYRGIHDMLGKGVPLKPLWAELAGKVTGTCKGKGGPMHITHPESGCMVTTGIVGAGMPIACGLAMASQVLGDGRVTVTNFGDGASNIGAFHESLNLASVWKLPVVFVCQNNLYAEHTALELGTSVPRISERAASYNMPGVTVDGNDPIATYRVARQAIDRARAGNGPTLIEALTFRFLGHVLGDASEYIPKDQFETAKANDPYPRYRQWLIDQGLADTPLLESIEREISSEIDAAVAFATASAEPEGIEIKRDVYAYELS
jgi:pyruvate dehydrogenase E1 component alpha subunit